MSFLQCDVKYRSVTDEHCSILCKLTGLMGVTVMSHASHKHEWSDIAKIPATPRFSTEHPVGFLRHMLDAISSWAARGDDADVAALLERSGGRLTDSIEREMFRGRSNSYFN